MDIEWIKYILDGYASEYNALTENWKKACSFFNTTPKRIVLVESIPADLTDEKNKTIFSRIVSLGKEGNLVRRISEFQPCIRCNKKAIPTRACYQLLKQNNKPVPAKWQNYCENC